MLKFAFAGFRHPHINAFYKMCEANPDVEIAYAFEENDEARAAAEEALGVKFTHADYADMLKEKDIDVVVIGDYYGIRGQRAIEALRAGHHIYSDKPLCTSLAELDEIERLSAEKNLRVGIMLDVRYIGWVEPLKKLISEGTLGEIHQVSFGGQHPLMYGSRAGWYFERGKHGGTINDIAVHGIDITEYVTGLGLKKVVAARQWNAYATEVDYFMDSAQFMAELENGAGLMADVSYAAPNSSGYTLPYYWRFNFWGTKGTAEVNYNAPDEIRLALDGEEGLRTVAVTEKNTDDCLKVFIRELAGEKTSIDTASSLRVARDTLTIQAAAK
ncbi:MAG: Gfo/Idh/MocA family oxidoreductase [Firmicutes bacterium]|nr:Gfo/Idh/MocA family oxidoreductase [Bacillota bacterium]